MHLAQLNIANMLEPLDHPVMKDFVDNVDRINEIADKSPGFIWRLQDELGDATRIKFGDNPNTLVNMSVWRSLADLFAYVYHSDHVEIFKRKKEWFQKMEAMHIVLWYVEEGYIPDLAEAQERLSYLQTYGESPFAFTFRKRYSIDDWLQFQTENEQKNV
ncbi:MAG: DUF3291 domain-containing protein [Bacteroidota bacterium]